MANPYRILPTQAFWRSAVAGLYEIEVDPVIDVPFRIGRDDEVATAGSCFAQHISRTLARSGYKYLVTEAAPEGSADPSSYGVFPARFGNIYTVRQLLQTFNRAYGLFSPVDVFWTRPDGALVDPFRPLVHSSGFRSPEELIADRTWHLSRVCRMFEDCNVFVFTLGLTECWRSTRDGAVFPVAPGVAAEPPTAEHEFYNLRVDEMVEDLVLFLKRLRTVNPGVRVILTVSPIPLIATYEPRHVLVSNTYSKAALRVVADLVTRSDPGVFYFPAFEIIAGGQAQGRYFAPDLRSVTEAGVTRVMEVFSRHLLAERSDRCDAPLPAAEATEADRARFEEEAAVVCDEEVIDLSQSRPDA